MFSKDTDWRPDFPFDFFQLFWLCVSMWLWTGPCGFGIQRRLIGFTVTTHLPTVRKIFLNHQYFVKNINWSGSSISRVSPWKCQCHEEKGQCLSWLLSYIPSKSYTNVYLMNTWTYCSSAFIDRGHKEAEMQINFRGKNCPWFVFRFRNQRFSFFFSILK